MLIETEEMDIDITGQNSSVKYAKLIILSLDISSTITFLEKLSYSLSISIPSIRIFSALIRVVIPHLFQ